MIKGSPEFKDKVNNDSCLRVCSHLIIRCVNVSSDFVLL